MQSVSEKREKNRLFSAWFKENMSISVEGNPDGVGLCDALLGCRERFGAFKPGDHLPPAPRPRAVTHLHVGAADRFYGDSLLSSGVRLQTW